MKKLRKLIIVLCAIAGICVVAALISRGAANFRDKYEGTDLNDGVAGIDRNDTYEQYLAAYGQVAPAEEELSLDLAAFTGDGEMRDEGLYTVETGTVTFSFTTSREGLYYIRLDYLPVESRGVDIERALYINGSVPFKGADTLSFNRLWVDSGEVKKDNQGNDIRPAQVERFEAQQVYCKDSMGYITTPYCFYIPAGENTLSLEAVNEPVILRGITLCPAQDVDSYETYLAAQPEVTMSEKTKTWQSRVQGEAAVTRSSPSLYARYDRSSPSTEPYSVTNSILNYIGGDAWNTAGQWIEWEVEVPEDGYYNISFKARQVYQRGSLSCRTLYLDGEIPFDEVSELAFSYDTSWQLYTLGDEQGTAYRFYMEKGKHLIRLEATLGAMGPILSEMENSVYRLNQIYRKILVLTGVNPDRFRDYNIQGIYPQVITAMDLESKRLYKLVDDTVAITGQKSDRIAVAQTLAVQLEQFVEYNERITQSFTNFKDNITSLGAAMQSMSETKLDIDYLIVSGEQAELPEVNDGFFRKLFHEIRSNIASYSVDYNALGNKYDADDMENNRLLDVWIVTGRDQSTILKTMIDDTFTPNSGVPVNLKLVSQDSLLSAVVAGNGPDVVLSIGSGLPVNYALRGAAEDLTQFADCEEVLSAFYPSAYTPMQYGGGLYGLPETQEYSLLFYRKDVLEELNLTPPETWDELIAMLPTIQGRNMSVGIPFPSITSADISVFNSMLVQQGGSIYEGDGKRTLIDSEAGVTAFEIYTSFYNDYSLPTDYDFVSRFRSGEMPIGLSSYTTYNRLVVSAPEIRGLWDFTLFPGTLKVASDGTTTVDHTVQSGGACCMMLATEDEALKKDAWEFMKWWVSEESQMRFGREIESVLGSSARYSTANIYALEKLSWSASQLRILKAQMPLAVGFPEVAGGYSTTRHITNAIRKVINSKDDPRETLIKYARTINEEITQKRREFDLPTD